MKHKVLSFIPIFIIGLPISCSPKDKIDLHSTVAIDSSFSPVDIEIITSAIDQWQATTSELVKINLIITDDPKSSPNRILKGSYGIDSSDRSQFYGLTTWGYSGIETTLYLDTITVNGVYLQEIAMHEFGHMLGLAHKPTGLMTAFPTGQVCIDKDTLDQFCQVRDCGSIRVQPNCITD